MENNINFESNIHKISNYYFGFKRYNRRFNKDDFINQLDIYTLDKILLHSIKFDNYTTRILYRVLTMLFREGESFEYDIPSFNMLEVYKISGVLDYLTGRPMFTLFIDNQTINSTVKLYIKFNSDEFEEFLFKFYFLLLIDLCSEGNSITFDNTIFDSDIY